MNKRIFLVDDDPYWTALLTELLLNLGYFNVKSFSNGADLLDNLYPSPEIVFLDYQMDDLDGLEVLKKLKATNPEIGVIFCTAYEDLSIAMHAMDHGSCDYLLKGNASIDEVRGMIDALTVGNTFSLPQL